METKNNEQILESILKDNPGFEVPQEVETRLRRHLSVLRDRMNDAEDKKRFASHSWGFNVRYMMPAVSLIMICLVTYIFMPGGGASNVYADVIKKVRNATSMTYTLIEKLSADDLPMNEFKYEFVFKEPHNIRVSSPAGGYSVIDTAEKKSLSVIPSQKLYIETDFSNAPPGAFEGSYINRLTSLPDRADEVLGEKMIDGRNVQGFRVTEGGMEKTLWVDVETEELVQMEGEYLNARGRHIVIKNIQLNIEYDDTFFSFDPPPEYTLQKAVSEELSYPDEQSLINMLDRLTSIHVDGLFPDTLNKANYILFLIELNKSGKFKESLTRGMSRDKISQFMNETDYILDQGIKFILPMDPQDWHYAGKDVRRNAVDTPVLWYKPDGSETYRVIYADLSVQDVAPEDLPHVPAGK